MYQNRFELIPAIDLIDGQCVRLFQGDYARKTTYRQDPVAIAQQWEREGADRIHLVDLDGAKAGEPLNLTVIEEIVHTVSIPCELGGGIRSLETVNQVLDLGVERVILGSIAATHPERLSHILEQVDPNQIVVGVDIKDGKPAIRGWLETVDTDLLSFLDQQVALGVKRIILTDISKDGAMQGSNIPLMQEVCRHLRIPVVASGGVTTITDVEKLSGIDGVEGCIIGKALYEGNIDLSTITSSTP